MNQQHIPVLLKDFLEFSSKYVANNSLSNESPACLWDSTFGLGGHSIAWLQQHQNGCVYASDCDTDMIELAEKSLDQSIKQQIHLQQSNFVMNPFEKNAPFDIILADLGVSSLHLDVFSRGISFRFDQLLDMRLDQKSGEPLYVLLAKLTYEQIRDIIYRYGEDSYAPKIAKEIIKYRITNEIKTTEDLKSVFLNINYPSGYKTSYSKRYPYVKTFQAFRIWINQEMLSLQSVLNFSPFLLKKGGILIIMSFHSLEDRIVKQAFKKLSIEYDDSLYAKSYQKEGDFKVLTKKPICATEKEISLNPRSRSVKMRVLQRR